MSFKNEEFYAVVSAIAKFIEQADAAPELTDGPEEAAQITGKDVEAHGYHA